MCSFPGSFSPLSLVIISSNSFSSVIVALESPVCCSDLPGLEPYLSKINVLNFKSFAFHTIYEIFSGILPARRGSALLQARTTVELMVLLWFMTSLIRYCSIYTNFRSLLLNTSMTGSLKSTNTPLRIPVSSSLATNLTWKTAETLVPLTFSVFLRSLRSLPWTFPPKLVITLTRFLIFLDVFQAFYSITEKLVSLKMESDHDVTDLRTISLQNTYNGTF
uniref:Uncharacterized protein n=1 Tax=Theileria parva TaxID=5875 RepID=Q4N1T6_THEPA|eukprot:XP_764279.1 hypothetical protein [Theileria parva strain Muguga]